MEKFSPPCEVQVPQAKILVLGPVGAGKSSFFNTVASIFRGRVTRQASSGNAEHSITSQVSLYLCVRILENFKWKRGTQHYMYVTGESVFGCPYP